MATNSYRHNPIIPASSIDDAIARDAEITSAIAGTDGTWTPTLSLATPGNSGFTYSIQAGSFLRIGNLIVAHFRVQLSAYTQGTGSGIVYVNGLPYTSKYYSGNHIYSGCTGLHANLNMNGDAFGSPLGITLLGGESRLYFHKSMENAFANTLDAAELKFNSAIWGTITYAAE